MESELAEFFLNYVITFFRGTASYEELCDIAEPSNEIEVGTSFIHEAWELPENFICLSTVQGEGCYLYDKKTARFWISVLRSELNFWLVMLGRNGTLSLIF